MNPDRATLLRTIRRAALQAGDRGVDPEVAGLLAVIDACANELALREDSSFYRDYVMRGAALVAEGGALFPGTAQLPAIPAESSHPAQFDVLIGDVASRLETVVRSLAGRRDEAARAFVRSAAAWELELHAHRLGDGGGNLAGQPMFGRDAFEAYLRERWPEWTDLRLTRFAMAPGGFSKLTLMFETEDSVNGVQSLVARIEPPVHFMDLDGMDVRNEFPVVQLAHRAGLAVAEPLWLEADEAKLGRRFFVSRRVAGAVMGTAKGSDDTVPESVLRMLANTMAQIHNVALDRDDPLIRSSHLARWIDYPDLRSNSLGLLDYWAGQLAHEGITGSPILADALAWLRDNVPDEDAPFSLIHGDVGLHNMMIENGDLTALLDWENCRIGDPAEDFSMLFAGIGDKVDRDDFVRMYREAGGPALSNRRLDWFGVYGGAYVYIGALVVLARLDTHEQANLPGMVFGLQFAHHYANLLPGLIAKAEARADGS